MSNRSLFEINHDYAVRDQADLLPALQRYLNSAGRSNAEALERYGIRVIGMRHHSSNYVIRSEVDGFPPTYLKAAVNELSASSRIPEGGGEEAALVDRIAVAVMRWGTPHFKHTVSANMLKEAIEGALSPLQSRAPGIGGGEDCSLVGSRAEARTPSREADRDREPSDPFSIEAQMAERLNDPEWLAKFNAGEDADRPFLTMVQALRAEEGDSITLLSDNPEGPPNNAVEVCGSWTNWTDRRFSGSSIHQAVLAAYKARLEPQPDPYRGIAPADREPAGQFRKAGVLITYDGEFDTGYRYVAIGDDIRPNWLRGGRVEDMYQNAYDGEPSPDTSASRIADLEAALLYIVETDRHYRKPPSPNPDGGMRGWAGHFAVRVLTGLHGSYTSDEEVREILKSQSKDGAPPQPDPSRGITPVDREPSGGEG